MDELFLDWSSPLYFSRILDHKIWVSCVKSWGFDRLQPLRSHFHQISSSLDTAATRLANASQVIGGVHKNDTPREINSRVGRRLHAFAPPLTALLFHKARACKQKAICNRPQSKQGGLGLGWSSFARGAGVFSYAQALSHVLSVILLTSLSLTLNLPILCLLDLSLHLKHTFLVGLAGVWRHFLYPILNFSKFIRLFTLISQSR